MIFKIPKFVEKSAQGFDSSRDAGSNRGTNRRRGDAVASPGVGQPDVLFLCPMVVQITLHDVYCGMRF
jgi:hypothetical protein